MKMNELFLGQLEREAAPTRRALERVPEGRNDWRPHPKSMPLGYLAALVASMPGWIAMMIDTDEFDINPSGASFGLKEQPSGAELLKSFDEAVEKARRSLPKATDEHLLRPWRMLVTGRVVSEQVRHVAISDSVFSHWAHHRGQLTVYLRLKDVAVPAIYGPSADEGTFSG
jgi:uncharacterized damage-inducible protein DinB